MKRITTSDFLDFLENHEYAFEVHGNLKKEYFVSSIFAPVEEGFYFFNGTNLHLKIQNSLFIVERVFNLEHDSNSYIIIEGNVQIIYYKFLSSQFSRSSTGIIHSSAIIHPEAVLGKNVEIEPYAIIGKCVIGQNVIVGSYSRINDDVTIGENTIIEGYCDIGARGMAWIWNEDESEKIIQPQIGGVKIGSNCIIGTQNVVVRGSLNENSLIGNHTIMAPGCRLGHGTQLGEYVHFANNVVTGGNTRIGNFCFVGSSAVFRSKTNLHDYTIVGAGAVVVKNTTLEGKTLIGNPAREHYTKSLPEGMPKPKNNKN